MRRVTPLHRSRGQSAVEFALILPIFILVVMAVFEFGASLFYRNAVAEAAREGVRWAIVHGSEYEADHGTTVTETDILNHVRVFAFGMGNVDVDIEVSGHDWNTSHNVKEPVKVTVTYTYVPITSHFFGGSPVELKSSAEAYIVY